MVHALTLSLESSVRVTHAVPHFGKKKIRVVRDEPKNTKKKKNEVSGALSFDRLFGLGGGEW